MTRFAEELLNEAQKTIIFKPGSSKNSIVAVTDKQETRITKEKEKRTAKLVERREQGFDNAVKNLPYRNDDQIFFSKVEALF